MITYAYNYAIIEPSMSNMCIEVRTTSVDCTGMENYIEIPVFDEDYVCKYYNINDGKFYYDLGYTQEYISPLL